MTYNYKKNQVYSIFISKDIFEIIDNKQRKTQSGIGIILPNQIITENIARSFKT